MRDPRPRSEKPLKGAGRRARRGCRPGRRALLCRLPGAWAGTEGTQRCARTGVVPRLPSRRGALRGGDLAGSLPGCRGGQRPVRAGQVRGRTAVPPAAAPRASAAPDRAVQERGNTPGSSTPTFGGINGLLYPSGPQHLPTACTFPVVHLGPFLVWNSGDPVSSPCFCRAQLLYLCGGAGGGRFD